MRGPAPCPIGGEGLAGAGGRFCYLVEQARAEAPQHGPCPQAPLPHPEATSALTCCRFCRPSGSAASTGSAMRLRRSSSSRCFSRSASTSLPMRLASCSSMYCFLQLLGKRRCEMGQQTDVYGSILPMRLASCSSVYCFLQFGRGCKMH